MARIPEHALERLKWYVSLARLIEGQDHWIVTQCKNLACRSPWHEGDREAAKLAAASPADAARVLKAANHVFGPTSLTRPKLGDLLGPVGGDTVGGQNALLGKVLSLADKGAIGGVYTVIVEGAVVNAVARVGTAYIPWAKRRRLPSLRRPQSGACL